MLRSMAVEVDPQARRIAELEGQVKRLREALSTLLGGIDGEPTRRQITAHVGLTGYAGWHVWTTVQDARNALAETDPNDETPALTLANLRGYLVRRVQRCNETMVTLAEFIRAEPVHSHPYNHRIAEHGAFAICRHVYQQLIEIIDRGKLPD